jgi:beta-glucosidase/6-phospho-beta-glucosidase/beta-galactosidase
MSKFSANRTETFWTHIQPTKKISEPNSKRFKRYDQIFKPTRFFGLQTNLHMGWP